MKKFALLFALVPIILASSVFAAWNFATESELDSADSTDINIDYEFDKFYSVTYTGADGISNLPSLAFGNRTFETDALKDYSIKSITMGNIPLTLGTTYTFTNRVLSIPNVTGKIVINLSQPVTLGRILAAYPSRRSENKFGDFNVYNTDSSNGATYSDNDGKLTYTPGGAVRCDTNNPVPTITPPSSPSIYGAFTVDITFKASIEQNNTSGTVPRTIFAMKEIGATGYLCWIGLYNGYLHIYAFRNDGPVNSMAAETKVNAYKGFRSFDFHDYDNKLVNLVVAADKLDSTDTGDVAVYITQKPTGTVSTKISAFHTNNVTFDWSKVKVTVGDLNPGRNLKFNGYVYDVNVYNRVLTSEEINVNLFHSTRTWPFDSTATS